MTHNEGKKEKPMKCIYCQKEIPDGSDHCPHCGAYFVSQSEPIVTKQESGVKSEITPENFRSLPTYKPNLIKMIIFGGLGFGFALIGMLGSLFYRFVPGGDGLDLAMLILGAVVGVIMIAFALGLNKKTFPQVNGVKIKGLELVPVLCISFGLCMIVVALVVQGIYFVVY